MMVKRVVNGGENEDDGVDLLSVLKGRMWMLVRCNVFLLRFDIAVVTDEHFLTRTYSGTEEIGLGGDTKRIASDGLAVITRSSSLASALSPSLIAIDLF